MQALEVTIVFIEQDVEVPKTQLSPFGFKTQARLAAQCMTDKCVDSSCYTGFLECCWRKRSALPVVQNVHIIQSLVHNWGIHSLQLLPYNGFEWLYKHRRGS